MHFKPIFLIIQKILVSRILEVYVLFNEISLKTTTSDITVCFAAIASVTTASRYVTTASCYQSRSSMYIEVQFHRICGDMSNWCIFLHFNGVR